MAKPNLKPALRATSKRPAIQGKRKRQLICGVTLKKLNKETLAHIRTLGPRAELSFLATIDGLMEPEVEKMGDSGRKGK